MFLKWKESEQKRLEDCLKALKSHASDNMPDEDARVTMRKLVAQDFHHLYEVLSEALFDYERKKAKVSSVCSKTV